MTKVHIKTIELEIGDKALSLSFEEATDLFNELAKLLGKQVSTITVAPHIYPVTSPPLSPIWYDTNTITCDTGSAGYMEII